MIKREITKKLTTSNKLFLLHTFEKSIIQMCVLTVILSLSPGFKSESWFYF